MTGRKLLTGSLALVAFAGMALAQSGKPMSPSGTAAAQVLGKWSQPEDQERRRYTDGKWIEVSYSRPILRGRTNIFGKGADYGKAVSGGAPVWRAGANQTTRLKTDAALVIGGKRIEPGEYSLFVDLKESGWTLIVSSQPYQRSYNEEEKVSTWGAYNYDKKYDIVRVPMTMITPAVSVDQFSIGFVDVTENGGKLAMAWEKTAAVVPFTAAQ
ncbi:MAG TPA: DUF2911 domain-containing protein [Thermoanaerobaculia bacterium]|nr:DUF2911 domain-containing protein [Thermoanaerobaculia bacterium]